MSTISELPPPPYEAALSAGFTLPHSRYNNYQPAAVAPPPPLPQTLEELNKLQSNSAFLKALARTAKPCPPWCVGTSMGFDLSTEMGWFETFLQPTDREVANVAQTFSALEEALRIVYPQVSLHSGHSNAAGIFALNAPVNFIAVMTEEVSDSNLAKNLPSHLNKQGFKVLSQFYDFRDCTCLHLCHIKTSVELILKYGAGARRAFEAANIIRDAFSLKIRREALCVITALLRQNKAIDDFDKAALSDEAVCVMVLAIANSYQPDDPPTAQRIFMDFFLTFGFPEHFDTAEFSVAVAGVADAPEKIHTTDALSVLDPGDQTRNLTSGITAEKLQYLSTIFNYCFRVVTEFCQQNDPHLRRAQTSLSTVIGGEPFWPRLLILYAQKSDPYKTFFETNWGRIWTEMNRRPPTNAGRGRR